MKKESILGMSAIAILMALYILVAFLAPFVHTATFWVSFIFTVIAFGVVAYSFYVAFFKNPDAKSRFYGFPIAKIGVIYGATQLIFAILFMALAVFVPVWVAVLVYAILLGFATIGLISAEIVVNEIQIQDVKLKKDVTLMRGLQSQVNQMASHSNDANIKALAEEFRYSDPVSNEMIADAESDLVAVVDELQEVFVEGDKLTVEKLCLKALALLAERNRLCKLNK